MDTPACFVWHAALLTLNFFASYARYKKIAFGVGNQNEPAVADTMAGRNVYPQFQLDVFNQMEFLKSILRLNFY